MFRPCMWSWARERGVVQRMARSLSSPKALQAYHVQNQFYDLIFHHHDLKTRENKDPRQT